MEFKFGNFSFSIGIGGLILIGFVTWVVCLVVAGK
jgi:hypothetical protein